MSAGSADMGEGPLLRVSGLSKEFFIPGSLFGGMRTIRALSDVSFSVA